MVEIGANRCCWSRDFAGGVARLLVNCNGFFIAAEDTLLTTAPIEGMIAGEAIVEWPDANEGNCRRRVIGDTASLSSCPGRTKETISRSRPDGNC